MGRRMRWAVVGTGGIARTTIGDLHATEDLDVVAVASRDRQRAEAFAAEHGVPRHFDSYNALFSDESVDVVYLCTPIATHADLAVEALRAGKHVLVEKAFAVSAEQAEAVAEVARSERRFVMEAMWTRFNPVIVQMLRDVAEGLVGDVRTVTAGFGIPLPPSFSQWQPELGGGALLDMGVYPLTLAHLLLGVPDEVRATGTVRADGLDTTDLVQLLYPDGRFAQAAASLDGFVNPSASIGGTQGYIAFDKPFLSAVEYRIERPMRGAPVTVRFDVEGAGYVPMFRSVNRAVLDGLTEHPLRPLSDTIDVLRIMDEVRRQISPGRPGPASSR